MRIQRGFTILELMIVVAIIAILASVVVPSWFAESKRAKARSEVTAMFAELGTKEEQYLIDNGGYLAAAACPAAPSTPAQDATPCAATGTGVWAPMRVALPETLLFCSYQITSGPSTAIPAPPAPFVMPPAFVAAPTSSWFYILATCDMDSDPTLNSQYFMSNIDSAIQSANEGY